jgi:lipid-binding SYLF domain-containing protein
MDDKSKLVHSPIGGRIMKAVTRMMFITLCFAIGSVGSVSAGWDANAEKKARETIAAFKKKDPKLQAFFDKAYGYAVFPTVGKGAIGIGGAHGKGVVFRGGKAIGSSSLTQVTIGFQLGGQAYSEIIFFKDKRTLDNFKAGNFELGAQASAVAATAGAAANADYEKGVAIFTMAKGGLMYEASVGGQKFSYHPN